MINSEKLTAVIAAYKEYFPAHWADEKYKWEAIKHFQENWDVNSANFLEMFMDATDKTYNLLANMNNYPRGMIKNFAAADAEAVRSMFLHLYDERVDVTERIEQFRADAENLRVKYDDGTWKQHYQTHNAITTYLWLRYPDKYYIYKYLECRAMAKAVDSDFIPKKGASAANVAGGLRLYDEISEVLCADADLTKLLQESLTDSCYSDDARKTMTMDLGFFVSHFYGQEEKAADAEWFPADYSPELSVSDWVGLLNDNSVFNSSSLEIMKRMRDYGGAATCKQLAVKYGETVGFYNMGSSQLAQRVQKKTGCPVLERDNEDARWWTILYVGYNADANTDGVYTWKLRDELSKALEQVDLSDVLLYAKSEEDDKKEELEPYGKSDFLKQVYMTEERYDTLVSLLKHKKNLILQGAPGVGKTYAAKRLAYSMMGVKDDTRIEFIQFHQNYSYEDFIMGYKPQDEGFKLTNGIFY